MCALHGKHTLFFLWKKNWWASFLGSALIFFWTSILVKQEGRGQGTPLKEWHGHAAAKSLQSCPTLRNPIDSSPLGSPIPGILQARTLEWVAISFSNAWKWKVKVKSLNRVWLSDPMDCSLPGSSIHGIFQARVLEWVTIAFSMLLLLSRFSCVQFCATPWTAAHQATPSIGFSRQEHWSRSPFPSPMHESGKWKWSLSVVSDS